MLWPMVGGGCLLPEKGFPGYVSEDNCQCLLVHGFVFGVDFILSEKFSFRVLV